MEKRLVAIVDDDASVRQSTCRLLRSVGYRAEAVGSVEEFLSAGLAERAACVILDVRMPGMGGLELQRRLVEDGSRVPIVFFTAHASDEEEVRALRAGAVDVLRKPVAKETLLRVLRRALGEVNGTGKPSHED